MNLPKRATLGGRGGEEIEMEPRLIKEQIDEAQKWLAVHSTATAAARVKYASFENFRE